MMFGGQRGRGGSKGGQPLIYWGDQLGYAKPRKKQERLLPCIVRDRVYNQREEGTAFNVFWEGGIKVQGCFSTSPLA